MKLLRHLPNVLTCTHLLCGCLGIIFTLQYSTWSGVWFVLAAGIFDFLDGFTARVLNVSSPIGKELDSLADMVSFGVLPSLVMFQMIDTISSSNLLPYVAFSLAIFSALRLAKFNIDENQKDTFIGLPTPANALFISSLVYLKGPWDVFISNDIFLVIVTFVFSFLLVAPWELLAFKFKNYQWANNKVRFTFISISVLLLAVWQLAALPFIILFYILISLLMRWIRI